MWFDEETNFWMINYFQPKDHQGQYYTLYMSLQTFMIFEERW